MNCVAIIAEFNPPHLGHAHLVKQIRNSLGEDTAVIAIMSGNFIQRGDTAICDAYTRAQMALSLGIDLVLELPFPYSSASAAYFASAGVSIASKLGCVDYLCFGSESGELTQLQMIADTVSSPAFAQQLSSLREDPANASKSLAELRTRLIASTLGKDFAATACLPNNILAIEYLIALKAHENAPLPLTFPRLGDYHDVDNRGLGFASASHIRRLILEQRLQNAKEHMTDEAYRLLTEAEEKGLISSGMRTVSSAVLTQLYRMCRTGDFTPFAECDSSLGERICSALPYARDLNELIEQIKAKHLTDAHVRRALLYAYFGITSTELHTPPAYTRLLASNEIGRTLLKIIKKNATIPYLTKSADYPKILTDVALRQADLAFWADTVFGQCLREPTPGADALKRGPYIGK